MNDLHGDHSSGRHRHRRRATRGTATRDSGDIRMPGRATLLGILAALIVMLGSGVAISLTSATPTDPPADAVSALGSAPTPTTEPSPADTPSPDPEPTPSPSPEPEPEPEPDPPPPPPDQPETDELTTLEDEVTALTNEARADAGCDPVSTDERLRTAARDHSRDMAANDYFSHTGRDGSSPFDRMSAAGYPNPAGENIAMGYRTPAAVMDGWMDSDGHRDNLLTCGHQAIGVGLAYDGNGRPYWTQVFGR